MLHPFLGRRARRAFAGPIALAVVMVTLLTGCGPTVYASDPMVCLAQPPATAADYHQAFSRRGVWAGGDGASTVTLPDGRLLWLFGDTFTDGLTPEGSPVGQFLHNTMVLQNGSCFAMLTNGSAGNRSAPLPPAEAGNWLWPTTGIVDPAGFVRITSLRMELAPGEPGWNWRVAGADISTLRLPDLNFVSTVHAPIAQDGAITWGGNAMTVAGTVYQYGTRGGIPVVARSTPAGFATVPWEVYTGTGWSTDAAQAASLPMERPTSANLTVIPYETGYLASSKSADMLSNDVTTWFGATPTGPFTRIGKVADTRPTDPDWFAYGGKVVDLPGAGLVAQWSQNSFGPTDDMRGYGPVFATPLTEALP